MSVVFRKLRSNYEKLHLNNLKRCSHPRLIFPLPVRHGINFEKRDKMMAKIALDAQAPDFALQDYRGETVRLSDFFGKSNVLLVFNRTFT
jgi:hypothetical protein